MISHQWPVSPSEALFCQEVATRGWQRNSNLKAGFPAHCFASTGLTFEFPTFHPQVHWHIKITAPPTWVTETGFRVALNVKA